MNVGVAALGDQLFRLFVGFVPDRSVQHHLGTVGARRFDFRRRRIGGHADDGVNAVNLCCERDALRMVAGRRANHAARFLFK